jgi:hypothetical protein
MHDRMVSLAPEMHNRLLDRSQELQKAFENRFDFALTEFKEKGFWMMQNVVEYVDTVGWNSVYDHLMKKGLPEDEATRGATAAVYRTAPSGSFLAMSEAESRPIVSLLNAFASQAFKVWNTITHLPDWKQKESVARYARRLTGVLMSAGVYTFIVQGIITILNGPEDDQKKDDLATQFILNSTVANFPILGNAFTSEITGQGGGSVIDQVKSFARIFTALENKEGRTGESKALMEAEAILESISVTLGLPFVEMKRIARSLGPDDDAKIMDRVLNVFFGGQVDNK